MVKPNKTALLFKTTRREIHSNIKQFLAIIFIAALAVCLFAGLTANYMTLEKRVDTIYEKGNIADLFVYVKETDEADIEFFKQDNRLKKVEKRLVVDGELEGFTTSIYVPEDHNEISKYTSLEGEEGFVIDSYFASRENAKIELGDQLNLGVSLNLQSLLGDNYETMMNLLDQCLKSGISNPLRQNVINLTFNVTGFMSHPESIEYSTTSSGITYLERDKLLEACDRLVDECFIRYQSLIKNQIHNMVANRYNQYLIDLYNREDSSSVVTSLNDYFKAKSNNNLITLLTLDNLPSNATIQADIVQAKQLVLVFPVIFFIVAILVVLTSISQLIFKSREEIGTLKALGFSAKEIILHYMSLGVILSALGSLIGGLVGPLFIPNILNIKYSILYRIPEIANVMPWSTILLSVLVFGILSAVVSFFIVKSEADLSPSESMRPRKIKDFKEKKKSSNDKSLTLKMAFRNIFLKKSRTLMVIFGVIGCTALLVSGFGILDTINYGVNSDLYGLYDSDIMVTYKNGESSKEQLNQIEHVKKVEETMTLPMRATYEGKAVDCTLYLVEPKAESFTMLKELDEGIVLSQKQAEELNVDVGDTISFTVLGNEYRAKIDGIFTASVWLYAFIDYTNIPDINFAPTQAQVFVDEDENISQVTTHISELNLEMMTKNDYAERVNNVVSSVTLMCNTIKVFAIALAMVVTYNLSILNFNERKRDIATLKVLGFNRLEIFKSLAVEILILTFLSSLIGLCFGYPLLKLILEINQTNLFYYQYHIEPVSYLISLAISLGTAIVVNLFLGRVANKVDAVEALKSVE